MRKALLASGQDRAFAGITETPNAFRRLPLCLSMIFPENRFTLFRIML
jgi:hypothetical protein